MIDKKEVRKTIHKHFKDKDVGVGLLYCISENKQIEDLTEDLVKLFSIPIVSNQRELLIAYHKHLADEISFDADEIWVDDFIKNNL